jgi:hypothetical protein
MKIVVGQCVRDSVWIVCLNKVLVDLSFIVKVLLRFANIVLEFCYVVINIVLLAKTAISTRLWVANRFALGLYPTSSDRCQYESNWWERTVLCGDVKRSDVVALAITTEDLKSISSQESHKNNHGFPPTYLFIATARYEQNKHTYST